MAGADGDSAIQAALEVLELARVGRFADVRDRFAPNLQPLVVPEALAQAWDAELDKRGAITMIGSPVIEPAPPDGIVVHRCRQSPSWPDRARSTVTRRSAATSR
jgi:hypothetical protein